MNDKEITEGNKLMAIFMGYTNNKWFENDDLYYHQVWDYLIPVYNKLYLLMAQSETIQLKLKNDNAFVVMWGYKIVFAPSLNHQIEITSAYQKILDMLKWYYKEK